MKASEFTPLLKLAKEATGTGPGKWQANADLLTWFRAGNCLEVIHALQAAARVCERPGGLAHTHLIQAVQSLKPLERPGAREGKP